MTPTDQGPARASADGRAVMVFLHVRPGAKRQGLEGTVTGADGRCRLRVAVTAPPDGGRANAAVCALLAKTAGVAKSRVGITAGAASRRKTALIKGDPATILPRIRAADATLPRVRGAGAPEES